MQPCASSQLEWDDIMGMFSAAQKKAPNATLCFLTSRMRPYKNKTDEYLDAMIEERRDYILLLCSHICMRHGSEGFMLASRGSCTSEQW